MSRGAILVATVAFLSAAAGADVDNCQSGISKGAIAIKGMKSAYLAGSGGDVQGDKLSIRH
eukprot:CAMPEP_0115224156 /NCGR_PEP_ID=MMETSP0270-20121206/29429_1 /TAXON_ID=71861 /ORGANISM="Scrippsiella trochoidea, Strain CCMP3099" /LENGTH=60 /DNA_ID=CAMNT_0002638457 /DNA_START=41 /DNA_END=220 /DNA_ORIENTATION=+